MYRNLLTLTILLSIAGNLQAVNFVVNAICYETAKNNSSVSVAVCEISDTVLSLPERVEWQGKSYRVEAISPYAFLNCRQLKTIEIPASCIFLNAIAFLNCSSLENILVADENPEYCDVDGVLFNSGMTDLVFYPRCKKATKYKIPQSVKTIRKDAFFKNQFLEDVEWPVNLNQICNEAFIGCNSLKSVCFPSGIEYVGDYAFYDCNNLMTVNVANCSFFSFSEQTFSFKTKHYGKVVVQSSNERFLDAFRKSGFENIVMCN